MSDYRLRGISLSQRHPEPQVNVGYDGANGWYAGAFGSSVEFPENGRDAQLVAYTGYSRRLPSGWSWETGATQSAFLRSAGFNYAEAFAGLASENINTRIYFAPNYFGQNTRTAYAEINGTYRLRERIHLLAHLGVLRQLSAAGRSGEPDATRFDTQIGVSAGLADWHLQLSWTGVAKGRANYPPYGNLSAPAAVLSASYSF